MFTKYNLFTEALTRKVNGELRRFEDNILVTNIDGISFYYNEINLVHANFYKPKSSDINIEHNIKILFHDEYEAIIKDNKSQSPILYEQDIIKINVDGSLDIEGEINYFHENRNSYKFRLPFDFNIVNGNFLINNNKLTSLLNIGCAKIVNSKFSCSNNNLKNLKGSPESVGDFFCSGNELTTLEGCPEKINGDFDCQNNKLSTFEFGPKYVKGNYICTGNLYNNLTIEDYPLCIIDGEFDISRGRTSTSKPFISGRDAMNFDQIHRIVKEYKDVFIPLLDNKVKFHQKIITLDKAYGQGELEKYYNTIKINKSTNLLL